MSNRSMLKATALWMLLGIGCGIDPEIPRSTSSAVVNLTLGTVGGDATGVGGGAVAVQDPFANRDFLYPLAAAPNAMSWKHYQRSNNSWTTQTITGSSGAVHSPALFPTTAGTLQAFYNTSGGAIMQTTYTSSWTTPSVLGAGTIASDSGISGFGFANGQMDLFWKNVNGNVSVKQWTPGTGWAYSVDLLVPTTCTPAAILMPNGAARVFLRNAQGNLIELSHPGTTSDYTTGWTATAHGSIWLTSGSAPVAAAAYDNSNVRVFYLDASNGGEVSQITWNSSRGWDTPMWMWTSSPLTGVFASGGEFLYGLFTNNQGATNLGFASQIVPQTGLMGGAFFDITGDIPFDPNKITNYFDDLQAVGMNTLIVGQLITHSDTSMGQGTDCSTTSYSYAANFQPNLQAIFNEATHRNMQVYVGLVSSFFACWNYINALYTSDGQWTTLGVNSVNPNFNQHPSFAGWYIPNEVDPSNLAPTASTNYYYHLMSLIHVSSFRPAIVAPILKDAPEHYDAQTLAGNAVVFQNNSAVDIQLWQDGVGSNAVPTHFVRPGALGSVQSYYSALQMALRPGTLWADIELFDYNSPLKNFRGTSASRLEQQINAVSPYSAFNITWLNQEDMSRIALGNPPEDADALRLFDSYRAVCGFGGNAVAPTSYSWIGNQPSQTYPDTANEMTDHFVGDPRTPTDPAWTGVLGTTELQFDFGSSRTLDWVGVHALGTNSWGIRMPTSIAISCIDQNNNWTQTNTFTDAGNPAEEAVVANITALNKSCQMLQVTLSNDGFWTFISEVEFFSKH